MEIHPFARTPATDEVLRRIGRNVVNFQHVEHLLKRLTVGTVPSGPISKMAARLEKHVATVNTSTMGLLAGRLTDTVLKSPAEKSTPDEIDEPWFGIRFGIETDAELVDRNKREMQFLVESRNDLIHNFLPRWHSSVGGDTAGAIEYLDAQMAETMRIMDRLKAWVKSMDESRRVGAALLASPELDRQFELVWLRSSRLVVMLGDIATRSARPDGWMLLSTAGSLIRRDAPDELLDLKKRFGLPGLKAVLRATEMFDVMDEKLPNGATRAVYRLGDQNKVPFQQEPTREPQKGTAA